MPLPQPGANGSYVADGERAGTFLITCCSVVTRSLFINMASNVDADVSIACWRKSLYLYLFLNSGDCNNNNNNNDITSMALKSSGPPTI